VRRFNVNERVEDVHHRSVGLDLPIPLHARLDELCQVVYRETHQLPPIKKMLAALVLAAPSDARTLDSLLRKYRDANVGECLLLTTATNETVEFVEPRPGPRRRRSHSA
jgi:hypothetical protein